MSYEYRQDYCNADCVPLELTKASSEGWELVCLIGVAHDIQLGPGSALANQQEFLLRRAVPQNEGQK